MQIAKDAADLTKYTGLNVMTFVGCMDFDKQLKHLEARHCDILVATPGRLLDFNQRGDVHLDMSQTQWATLRVDRAEPLQSGLSRPDNAFLAEQGRLLVGWPTTLALAPDFADRVLSALARDGIHPSANSEALPDLPKPAIGQPAWEQLLP